MSERNDTTTDASIYQERLERISQRLQDCRRFHGFHTSFSEVGNQKSQYGEGGFTDFTDFTPSEMGVYVAPARPRSRPHARPNTYPISNNREIREIREFARRQRGNSPRFRPRGVKGVKSTAGIDMELIK